MLRILIPALLIALTPLAARAQSCSQNDIRQTAAAMDVARADLRALPLGDGMVTDESPRAQAAIAAMKARIGTFVTAALRCAPASVTAKAAQNDLSRLGHGPETARPDSDHFGSQLGFAVRRVSPGLIAVVADFNVECGDDAMLMIFAWQDGGWREVLRDQAAPYDTVAGAFADFDYAISPPDAAGHWFVVTTTVAAWCSSNWSDIHYAVLRPSSGAPRTIFSAHDSIFREDESARLRAGIDSFDLRYDAESVDNAVFTRQRVRHFSVTGDTVRRTAPLAGRPRDFAEEWIASPWQEAQHWTATGASLEALHAKLAGTKYGLEYLSIRKCGTRTQIEFQPYDSDPQHYYLLVAGNRDFVLENASLKADPRCTGKNLYDPDHPN